MNKLLVLILIVATTFLIATIVINIINVEKCSSMVVPSYSELNKGLTDALTYKTQLYRFVAESIAKYKIDRYLKDSSISITNLSLVNNIDPEKLLDYAIHIIVFTDILYSNPTRLSIITHPNFVEAINSYSTSEFKFISNEKKEIAIEVLGITDDNEKTTFRNMPDSAIYILLTTGYKIIS